jgi:hypothetical protein
MIPAWSLAGVRHDLEHRFARDGFHTNAVKMVGLLLARPQATLASTEIVPNLPYFHHRAGKHIHFFCVGYGGYWPSEQVPDAENVVTIDHTKWLYSDRLFNEFRAELEGATRWRYSGGSDLVLTNSTWDAEQRSADLDFTSALAMNLEQAVADGAIPDVARWFERIFQFAEHNSERRTRGCWFRPRVGDPVATARKCWIRGQEVASLHGHQSSRLAVALRPKPVRGCALRRSAVASDRRV